MATIGCSSISRQWTSAWGELVKSVKKWRTLGLCKMEDERGGCGVVGGAWNKSTFIYQRLKFQFFSNFLPFKCTRSAKWPTRRRSSPSSAATDCGTSLLCGGRRGRWTGLMLGVAALHKLCHELKFFSNSNNNNNRRTMPKTTQFFSILFQFFFFSSHFAFHIAWRADRGRDGGSQRNREKERGRKSGRVKTTPGYSTFTASSI